MKREEWPSNMKVITKDEHARMHTPKQIPVPPTPPAHDPHPTKVCPVAFRETCMPSRVPGTYTRIMSLDSCLGSGCMAFDEETGKCGMFGPGTLNKKGDAL